MYGRYASYRLAQGDLKRLITVHSSQCPFYYLDPRKNCLEKESARLRVELKLFNLNSGRNLSIDKDIKIIIIQEPDG